MKRRSSLYWIGGGAVALIVLITGIVFYLYPGAFSAFAYFIFILIPLLAYVIILFTKFSSVLIKQMAAEKELQRKRQENMINSLQDGLVVYDLAGKIVSFNPKAEELLWVAAKNLLGKHPDELDTQANNLFANVQSVSSLRLDDFEKKQVTITIPENRIFEVMLVPLVGGRRRVVGSMRIVHDITKEEEVERLKWNIVATVGHQLRTPLSGIKWALNMFLDEDFGAITNQQRTHMEKSIGAVDRLIEIVRNLLDVSQVEEKRMVFHLMPVDVYKLLQEVIQDLMPFIQKEERDFILEEPPPDLPEVTVDPGKLKMALRNVIDNAFRYTHTGESIRVRIRLNTKNLFIEVQDSGIGIPETEQKHLFTKFFRASDAVRLHTEGSGLGLFIAKQIITRLNGKIWVESEENKGSTFTVQLPLVQPST